MITYVLLNQLPENTYNRVYPLTHSIPSVMEVYDEKTKSRRYIRCCSAEKSIFMDEQNPSSAIRRIVFNSGVLAIDERDVNIINYLNACDMNFSKANRDERVKAVFKLLDVEEDARLENEDMNMSFEAESIARNMAFDELLDFCRGADISIDRGAEEIKYDVYRIARNSPEYFLDMYNDPVVKRLSVIRKAEDDGVLYFDVSKRQVFMIENDKKTSVKVIPLGVDMHRHFSEWTFENEGKETFAHIEKLVNKDEVKTVTRGRRTSNTKN